MSLRKDCFQPTALTALENVVLGERRAHGASRAEAEERGTPAPSPTR
jgi:hypothetical protein